MRPEIIARADWFRLPLYLRHRWWIETDYGRREPSLEPLAAVEAALKEVQE